MQEQLRLRLDELKKEFETGQSRFQELERQQTHLRETLLRISGAIQILEEMLASGNSQQQDHPANSQGAGSIPIAQRSGA